MFSNLALDYFNDFAHFRVFLLLLDLYTALDTMSHAILFVRLNQLIGTQGAALNWFSSHFHGSSFQVMMGDSTSAATSLPCGIL